MPDNQHITVMFSSIEPNLAYMY